MMKIGKVTCGLAVFGLFAMANMAQATEGGGSTYPGGTENYLAAAVPPPGFYVLEYGQMYTADAVKDNSGNTIPIPGFKLNVAVAATRLIWSTPNQVLGGNLVLHTILPLVNVSVGGSQTKVGLGDVTIGAGIAKHYSPELHTVMAVDAVLPTGAYDKNEAVNIGRNYYSLQPLYGLSYVQNSGFNGDFKLTFNLNSQNSATNYTSGNEVFVDYAAGYGLANGWVVGVGGYLAFCSESERAAVLQRLVASEDPGNYLAHRPSMFKKLIAETQKLGYGVRATDFGGHFDKTRRESDDGRDSIAVPIWAGTEVVAVINLTWMHKAATVDQIVKSHLASVKEASQEITTKLMAQ